MGGDRLVLGVPTLRDAPALAHALRDRLVTRTIALPAGYALKDARAFIQRSRALYEEGSAYNLSVYLQDGGKLIGGCGLRDIDWNHKSGHIGYWIARPYWGQGYATEAASHLLRAAFRDLRLHRIFTGVFPDNPRSMSVLRRLGFRVEGRSREAHLVGGRYRDFVLFGLLRREFRPFPSLEIPSEPARTP
ncbi:MAG: GNAT family N-acetyltransferase [Thermoplasmata archaeon]|nr:GNAT family N-acetyltransferase [Thermoplasmata archaeon]